MKIIIDECLHSQTYSLLENKGFTINTIKDIIGWGATDEEICEYASSSNIPIITHDRRFGQIYFESIKNPSTIIIIKIVSPHPKGTNILLEKALQKIDLESGQYKNKLILVSAKKIRIRSKN